MILQQSGLFIMSGKDIGVTERCFSAIGELSSFWLESQQKRRPVSEPEGNHGTRSRKKGWSLKGGTLYIWPEEISLVVLFHACFALLPRCHSSQPNIIKNGQQTFPKVSVQINNDDADQSRTASTYLGLYLPLQLFQALVLFLRDLFGSSRCLVGSLNIILFFFGGGIRGEDGFKCRLLLGIGIIEKISDSHEVIIGSISNIIIGCLVQDICKVLICLCIQLTYFSENTLDSIVKGCDVAQIHPFSGCDVACVLTFSVEMQPCDGLHEKQAEQDHQEQFHEMIISFWKGMICKYSDFPSFYDSEVKSTIQYQSKDVGLAQRLRFGGR